MTAVFSLAPIPSTSFFPLREIEASSSRHVIDKLPAIRPEYSLEAVDEYEWQGDKVLPGVERGMEWARPAAGKDFRAGMRSRAKGKQRAEVREVEEGIWASRKGLAFPQVDRLAIDAEACNPFQLALPSTEAVIRMVTPSTEQEEPLRLAQIPSEPEQQLSSTQMIPILLQRAALLQNESKHIRWDSSKGRYRFSSRRLAQVGNEDLAVRAEMPLRIATALERLDSLVASQGPGGDTRTSVALRYATRTYLTYCRSELSSNDRAGPSSATCPSLRDLEQALEAICGIWSWPLDADTSRPSARKTPNAILSNIYTELTASPAVTGPPSARTVALAFMLQHVSQPFLQLIAAWVGLAPESSIVSAAITRRDQPWADLGITEHSTYIHGRVKVDYTFDHSALPIFVSPEIGQKIFEGGKSLRLLREASPGHPAADHWEVPLAWEWQRRDGSPEAHTGQMEAHVRQMGSRMESWRDSLQSRSNTPVERPGSGMSRRSKNRGRLPETFRTDTPALSCAASSTKTGATFTMTRAASLHELSQHLHLPHQADAWPRYIANTVLALPLAHADIVNNALVTLLFDELHYASHLDVLHAYWLGGDAAFSERVSAALFGVGREDDERETGLGRRARTRARMGLAGQYSGSIDIIGGADGATGDAKPKSEWGIALGVGLNDRQRWPPGGSEMAYALRTTLVDAEISSAVSPDCTEEERYEVWEKVQDTVSFAIRPLPNDEEQRKMWMDPQSIEALDFLFLAYSPPGSLSIVLPRDILDRYQAIHNHLLRFSRAQVVLRGVYRDIARRAAEQPALPMHLQSVANELRVGMAHFVETSVRYMVDIAIGVNLGRMRERLSDTRTRVTPDIPARDHIDDDSRSGDEPRPIESTDRTDVKHAASVQSLIDDHRATLNGIMACCLLGEDEHSEHAYDAVMRVLTLVLDVGKAVRCAVKGWTEAEFAYTALMELRDGWKEAEARFTRSISRLARSARDGVDADLPAQAATVMADSHLASDRHTNGKQVEMALREWLLRLDLYVGTTRPTEIIEEAL